MVKRISNSSDHSASKPAKERKREIRKIQSRIHAQKDQKSLIDVPYRKMISSTMAKSLSENILNLLEEKKIYRESGYTAKDMAKELHTNTRYLSAVVNSHFKKSYSSLINEYRIKEAVRLMVEKRYLDKTIEEIGLMVGFANRQSFYAAFSKFVGKTPRSFRVDMMNI
ncbi:MAG: AraC family transcriptional regulator [Bacteroidaceae bacterium]|nr:AraC family transcriptional regulator [Bacteroidaceae bacterium]